MAGPKAFGATAHVSPLTPVIPGGGPLVSIIGNVGNVAGVGIVNLIDVSAASFDPAETNSQISLMTSAVGWAHNMPDDANPGQYSALFQDGDDADGIAPLTEGGLITNARGSVFNGTAWDRSRSGAAAILAALSSMGAALVTQPGQWSVTHAPAAATKATITRAAGAAGVCNVCTSIDATLIIPPTVNQPIISLTLRDGASGAGTILWSRAFGVGAALAAGGQQVVSLSGLNIPGTEATAMTLEFSAAGEATTVESVSMTGYTAQ
jgi:hypothetical protein